MNLSSVNKHILNTQNLVFFVVTIKLKSFLFLFNIEHIQGLIYLINAINCLSLCLNHKQN